MKAFTIILHILIFILLTVLTQIGGFIFLLSLSTHFFIRRKIKKNYFQKGAKILSFVMLYSIATFVIVPLIAKPLGRVPLPVTGDVRPLNFFTCLLNRHYVKPELKGMITDIAKKMKREYPGTIINYLDGNFPFIDGFPLIPHLNHNDGKKLDLSFYYRNSTGKPVNECPSFIGYGICEEPGHGEENRPVLCSQKGYWQYSLLRKLIPQNSRKEYLFDMERTSEIMNLLCREKLVEKVFLEPHLKKRMNLKSDKIRFHGCQAVRHDDHIHLQITDIVRVF